MTVVYSKHPHQKHFVRYQDQWETAILAATMKAAADLTDQEASGLAKIWLIGIFNAAGAGVTSDETLSHGTIEWVQAGPTQFDCIYTGPMGIKCSLARVYEQPNGSWAALVIAGVKEDHYEALATAEWAISRLAASH